MDKITSTREFFDQLADDWDENTHHDPSKLDIIVSILGLKPGDRVLDVGCGTGIMIPHIRRYLRGEGVIVAVDVSERMIDIAKEKFPPDEYPDVKLIRADINEMTISDEYDAILCYSCFPHLKDQPKAVRHLSGGLRDEGRLIIAHSESRDSINDMHKNAGDAVSSDYLPTSEEIAEMMKRSGLDIKRIIDSQDMFVVMGKRGLDTDV